MIRPPRPSRRHYRRVALALSPGIALGGCQRSTEPGALIAEARQYRQSGDINAAVIQLKNALQEDPNNRDARRLLGEVYIDQADAVAAEKELRRALALGAPSADLLVLLGKSLLLQGQYQRLLDEFDSVSERTGRPAILALRGNALLGLDKRAEARALFDQALQEDHVFADALLGLARIAFAEHQPAAAASLLGRALAAHPGDADCLRFKGDLLRIDGKHAAALAAYRALLALHPHNAQARVDVASLLIDEGKFADARAELRAARKLSPGRLSVFYTQAMLDYRAAQYPAAIESLQQILRGAPDYAPALLLLGEVESATGANQLAEQHVRKFLDAYPGHLHATKLMAALQLRANSHADALALLASALAQHPDDVDLLTLAGEAHMRARNFDRAAACFEQASALRPRAAGLDIKSPRTGALLVLSYLRANAPAKALAAVHEMEKQDDGALVQNLKGGVLLARHDVAGARASFARALAFDPRHLPALDNLAQLDVLEQRPADARKRYQAALARSPRSVPLMEALARLATRQGQPAEAIGWLERACKENPQSLPLALRLVEQYARGSEAAKALVLARKLQASNPSNPEALAKLAEVHAFRQDLAAAAEAYAKLAVLLPAAATPQMRLAALKLALHEPAAATAALRKAVALEPDSLDAHQMLLDLLVGQGKFDDAARLAGALQQRRPQAGAGFKFEGDLLTAQRKPAAALAAYERAFAREPGGALVIQLHAALTTLGRAVEADARTARWLEQHPDDVPVRLHDAGSKLVRNDLRGAIGQLETVLRRDPHNVLALNDLAWALHRIDLKRALALLQQASALAPDASEIRYHFGLVLAKSGDKRGARRELERLLAAPGEFPRRADATALLATL